MSESRALTIEGLGELVGLEACELLPTENERQVARAVVLAIADGLETHEFHLGEHYDQNLRLMFYAAVETVVDELRRIANEATQ